LKSIRKSAIEIAEYLSKNPELVDLILVKKGQSHLSVYNDLNFGPSIPDYTTLMRQMYLKAIEDLSNGSQLLSRYSSGIGFKHGKLFQFSLPQSELYTVGTLVAQISLYKHIDLTAFGPNNSDLQAKVEAAVYLLIYHLSKVPLRP